MSNDGSTQVPPNSTGNKIDCSSLSVSGATVYRQRVVIADNSRSANYATVSAGSLQVIVTNSPVVTGQVSIAAGTSKIGFIGKVSAAVALAAGTQHVGEVNISIMPAVVVTSITNAINISAMPSVNVNGGVAISGTATAIIGGFLDPSGQQRNVVDSANTALRVNVVAGGAGGGAVFGQIAVGTSLSTTNVPVLMGGNDNATFPGTARALLLDANGRIILGAGANNIGQVNVSIMPAVVVTSITNAINVSAMPTVNVNLVGMSAAALPVLIAAQSAGMTVAVSLGTQVVLAAGTANIGAVSLGAQVASGTSATAASVVVMAGFQSKVSAGAAGASAGVAWTDPSGRLVTILNHPAIVPSATQGPFSQQFASSASTVLVASAGAASIYVTSLLVTNGSASFIKANIFEGAHTASSEVVAFLAASGGGFSHQFNPPWKLSAGTALSAKAKPSGSCVAVVQFFVGP